MIKISAVERPKLALGQLIVFGLAILVVMLVELPAWLSKLNAGVVLELP